MTIFSRQPIKVLNNTPIFINIKEPVYDISSAKKKAFSFFSRHLLIKKIFKIILWPYLNWRKFVGHYLINGFIEKKIAGWMRKYIKEGIILEVGVGSGRLLKYIKPDWIYFGFDVINLSELKKKYNKENIVLFTASVEDIPLKDNSIDYILSTETLEHIRDFSGALDEVHRVCKNGAKLIISIPNNYCYKYKKKGPHPDHVNSWAYQEFIDLMAPRFKLLEDAMKGFWLPVFKKSRYSFQISYNHRLEHYNTNFFFVFECKK